MDIGLPGAPTLIAFMLASLVLAVTPGPAVLYITARTLSQGRSAGLASVAGVALGNLGIAVAAALGLGALLALSATAFSLVKFAGAAYLIWLGIKALRSAQAPEAGTAPAPEPPARIFRQGLVVALLNPKTALFFAAFLPQFVQPHGSPALQGALLGALFVLVAGLTDSAYVLLASLAAPLLHSRRAARSAQLIAGLTYLALGVLTALSSRPGGQPRA